VEVLEVYQPHSGLLQTELYTDDNKARPHIACMVCPSTTMLAIFEKIIEWAWRLFWPRMLTHILVDLGRRNFKTIVYTLILDEASKTITDIFQTADSRQQTPVISACCMRAGMED
jgi:hypothetical protein